jgi:hypothetical protein
MASDGGGGGGKVACSFIVIGTGVCIRCHGPAALAGARGTVVAYRFPNKCGEGRSRSRSANGPVYSCVWLHINSIRPL